MWLWRVGFLRNIGLIKTPNLNGVWHGSLSSSYDQYKTKHQTSMTVHQTWTHMSMCLRSDTSESHSLSGIILSESPVSKVLSYEFRNEPKPYAIDTMHVHRGTGRLALSKVDDAEVLDGEYFTGRDRQTYGTLHFEKPLV